MIFHQIFHADSRSFAYLIGDRAGGEAVLLDPVREAVGQYLGILRRLELKLAMAIDTHLHADHVTGAGVLAEATGCAIAMGGQTRAGPIDRRLHDGEWLRFDGFALQALHTPGHTQDSYCFLLGDRVCTGDTLLISATGRTDLPGGDARQQFRSLHERLLSLPDETLVFPGHDYFGNSVSTIGHERTHNPRLQYRTQSDYADCMARLGLPRPRAMAAAIPANLQLGRVVPRTEAGAAT